MAVGKAVVRSWLAVSALVALSACGGGGGGNEIPAPTPTPTPGSPTPTPTPVPTPLPTAPPSAHASLTADCNGADCGALDANNAGAAGVSGTWSYDNTTAATVLVDINIANTLGRTGALIVSNTSSYPVTMYNIPIQTSMQAAVSASQMRAGKLEKPPINQIPASVRNFVRPTAAPVASQNKLALKPMQRVAYTVGSPRNWIDADNGTHATTLRQSWTTADGRVVNIWVEDSQFGTDPAVSITAADVTGLGNAFASGTSNPADPATSIYSMVTGLAGLPWGAIPANKAAQLIDASQPIDIVIINITPDNAPFGTVGYFFERNNYRASYSSYSNEALSFFLDSETIYKARSGARYITTGMDYELSTLAHEFTHMINFYQRTVLRGSVYDNANWLEEMTAMGMEDIVDTQINPAYNAVRDLRFSDWLGAGGYNCGFDLFNNDTTATCFSYSTGGAFIGYLTRQYGVANFYQQLLTNFSSTDSLTLLDNTIRAAAARKPGTPATLASALRHWQASVALFSATPPATYGYPQYVEAVNGTTFTLPALTGSDYTAERDSALPGSQPSYLVSHGMFPTLRRNLGATWTESVAVPAGTSLTVVLP